MADLLVHKGKTSKLLRFFIQDTRQSDGSGLTGLVFNTASLSAYYIREGDASATAITLATMTLGTWATGGFVVVDGTNMPGYYELGIPNAAIAGGADSVIIMLKGAANMAVAIKELQLSDFDPNDAVRAGLTALPNAALGATGGFFTGVVNGGTATAGAASTITLAASASTTVNLYNGMFITLVSGTGAGQSRTITAYSAGRVATVDSAWAVNPDNTTVYELRGHRTPALDANLAVAANAVNGNVTGSVGSVTGAVGSVTGNVGGNVVGSVASVVGAVGSVTVVSDKTGYALTAGERTAISAALVGTALTELAQAQPSATPTINDALMLPFMMVRNTRTVTSTTDSIQNNAGTVVAKSSVSDDGTTFTRQKLVSGP